MIRSRSTTTGTRDIGISAHCWRAGERNHEAAFSYAKKAVSLNGHSFSLTTLGTVLLRAAADERTKLSDDERFEAYEDGERTLRESRKQEVRDGRGGNEHPFETYFAYAGYVSKLFGGNPARLLIIETNTRWWLEEAATHSSGNAGNTVISRWQGKYLSAKNSCQGWVYKGALLISKIAQLTVSGSLF